MFICSGVLYANAAETTGLENESIFNIKNVNSGLMLDLYNSNDANGTNVQQYTADGTNAQKWKIIYNSTSDCYYIKSVRSLNNGNSRQLDVYCTSSNPVASGHNVQIWSPGDDPSSTWSIVHISNGQYKIVLKQYPTLALTVSGNSTASGANVLIQTYTGSSSQKWTFEEVTLSQTTGIVSGETYYIRSKYSNKNLDIANGSTANGTNVFQTNQSGLFRQQWVVTYLSDGYYVIRPSQSSTTALAIANNYTLNSSNVCLREVGSANDSTAIPNYAKWQIVKNTGGASTGFRLVPKSSYGAQSLSIQNGSGADGANVLQLPYSGAASQQWLFFEAVDYSDDFDVKSSGKAVFGSNVVVHFEASESGLYIMETAQPNGINGALRDTVLQLYDSQFNLLATNDDINTETGYSRISRTLSAGHYYIKLLESPAVTTNVYAFLSVYKSGSLIYCAENETLEVNPYCKAYADLTYSFSKIGDATATYNCFAYVMGVTDHNMWPKQALGMAMPITVSELDDYMNNNGYVRATQPSANCIIAFGKDGYVEHFAKVENGITYAKLGTAELVSHGNTYFPYYSQSQYGYNLAYYIK